MSSRASAAPLSAELRRSLPVEWLRRDEPVGRGVDHPEPASIGTEAWVRQLRKEWVTQQPVHDPFNDSSIDGEENPAK